jgi:hypothetical protein
MVSEQNRVLQAEPFESTLEAFRLRVITKGGNVEEHYAIRKIEQQEERLRKLEAERDVLTDAVRDMLAWCPGCDGNGVVDGVGPNEASYVSCEKCAAYRKSIE